ncbi:nuclear transport factor 2 family protein [Cellulomonas sp. NPDC089187]|uniref:nuclear transport factor 2 family protein n=1 Tax=Cellulomonas sp. NPDC089187 TaxID=3154970 RepID=UPI00343508E9
MTMTTAEATGALLQHYGAGELDALMDLFADTVDLDVPGAPHVPWTGARSDKAGARAFFDLLINGGLTEPEAFDVHHIVVDGDQAVVLGRSRFRVTSTGRSFDNPFAIHVTVQDGKVVRYHMHEESYAIAEAFDR